MTADLRPIDSLIGVYNADGGIMGELRYVAAKVTGRSHCPLCDLTHRGLTRRADWTQACGRLSTPFELAHLNERADDVRRASHDNVPCVLARVGEDLVTLMGPGELDDCAASVGEFERRLRAAAVELGLGLG